MYNTYYHGFVRKRKEDYGMSNPSSNIDKMITVAKAGKMFVPTGGFDLASFDDACSETPDQVILNYKGCNNKPLGYQEQVDGVPWFRLPDDRKVEIGRNALKELVASVCEKILALATA